MVAQSSVQPGRLSDGAIAWLHWTRWTSTSSGRWPRPPSGPRWTRCWGRPSRRWRGGDAQPGDRGPRRSRRPRGPVPPRPAAAGAPRGPVADRLDQPAGAELRLPPAHGPAGRGVRRGDVLRPVLDHAAAADRGPRLRRHRLPRSPARRTSRADLERALGPAGDAAADGQATWLRSPCLGLCERAPAAMFTIAGPSRATHVAAPVDAAGVVGRLPDRSASMPRTASPPSRTSPPSRRPASPRPASRASGSCARVGASTRRRSTTTAPTAATGRSSARARVGRDAVIDEVTESGLVGRGGAAFPTGRKWAAVAGQPAQPHYLVCNADESEPGTFKDRVLMEDDPFAVVEAMTIAAFAVGAEQGYLYIRGEYPLAEARMRAIAAARGLLGADVLGSATLRHRAAARRRRLHLRRGDGAVQVDRGQARRAAQQAAVPGRGRACSASRPPSTTSRRSSTCSLIVARTAARRVRGDRHARARPARSSSASRGHVARPGRLRGRRSGRRCASCSSWPAACRAAARSRRSCSAARRASSSGPTRSTCRSPSRRTRAIGATLGSGVVMVFDETADLRRHAPADRPVLPRRVVRPVRAVPGRHRAPGGAARAPRGRPAARRPRRRSWRCSREIGQAMRDASHLRPRPDGIVGDRERAPQPELGGCERARPSSARCRADRDAAGPAASCSTRRPARPASAESRRRVEAPAAGRADDRRPAPSPSRPARRSSRPAGRRASTRRRSATSRT